MAWKKIGHNNMLNASTAANGITDADKKKSAFLAVIRPATYTLVRNLVSPDKAGEKSYDKATTPSEMTQRARFNSRIRKPGENVATFVSELRSLAEFCTFGTSLEDMLRDRLICGINNRTEVAGWEEADPH